MPQGDKSACTDKQKRQTRANGKGHEQKGVTGRKAEARGWATVNQLPGGGRKIDARRKVPSGPVGGSGRKTNLSRSS
jgi:hypothetical protein